MPAGSAFLLELCAHARSLTRAQEVFHCWWELGEMFLLFPLSWLWLPWGLSVLTLSAGWTSPSTPKLSSPLAVSYGLGELRVLTYLPRQPRVQERACLSPVSSSLPQ